MEQIARYKPGDNIPVFAVAAILAGRFVKISATKTAQGDYSAIHCGLGEYPFGVAEADSAAATEPAHSFERRVNVTRRGSIARVLVGASDVVAGTAVKSDATGKCIPQAGTGVIAGYACNSVTTVSAGYVEVDLL